MSPDAGEMILPEKSLELVPFWGIPCSQMQRDGYRFVSPDRESDATFLWRNAVQNYISPQGSLVFWLQTPANRVHLRLFPPKERRGAG
jgi:hypothetical protein